MSWGNVFAGTSGAAVVKPAVVLAHVLLLGAVAADLAGLNKDREDLYYVGSPVADCLNAVIIEAEVTVIDSNVGVSGVDESSCGESDSNGIWYRYSPEADGTITVDTVGSGFDTVLSIYAECGGVELACNDNAPGESTSIIENLAVENGEEYFIRVGGVQGAIGEVRVYVDFTEFVCTPVNVEALPDVTIAAGDSLSISAVATGDCGPLDYTWTWEGLLIASTPSLLVENTTVADAGTYEVCVSDGTTTACESFVVVVEVSLEIPTIVLLGSDAITLECGTVFNDPGAIATDDEDGDLTENITVSGVVDTATPGVSVLTYEVTDTGGNAAIPVTRTITVVDTTAPIARVQDIAVELDASGFATISVFDVDNGSSDSCSAGISATLSQTEFGCEDIGENTVEFTVVDASSNVSVVTAVVFVIDPSPSVCFDTAPPVLSITGPASLAIECGSVFSDPGATAFDSEDGNLTASIVVSGDVVDTNTPGVYTIVYTVEDSSGNQSVAQRIVAVRNTCIEGEVEGEVLNSEAYVSVATGSDSTGDGSAANPWRTIAFALEQLGEGTLDVPNKVLLLPGVFAERVILPRFTQLIGPSEGEPAEIRPQPASLSGTTPLLVAGGVGPRAAVETAEGVLLRNLQVVIPSGAQAGRVGVRVDGVEARLESVSVEGSTAVGLEITGQGSSGSRIEDCEFTNLATAVIATDTGAEFFRNLFSGVSGDAIRIAPLPGKGSSQTPILGDIERDQETGSNRFSAVSGKFIRNDTGLVVLAQLNDFGTNDQAVIDSGIEGAADAQGALKAGFAIVTLTVSLSGDGNAPVRGAVVSAISGGSNAAFAEQAAGVYVATASDGVFSITARANGYKPVTVVRVIPSTLVFAIDLSLERSAEIATDRHAADADRDGSIALDELLRVIQLYQASAFSCAPNSEDGYQVGTEGGFGCLRHAADYTDPAWDITLNEILRIVQFHNAGGFEFCPNARTEDLFCLVGP